MKYKITFQENGKIKKIILEQREYETQKLPENILSIKKSFDIGYFFKRKKPLTTKIVREVLYELNMMLEANVLLDDAFDILIESTKNSLIKEFLQKLKHSYINHVDIKKSLQSFIIDEFIVSSFRIIQKSGDPKQHIKVLYEILDEELKTRAKIQKAFSYPLILLVSFIFALIGIFKIVVPKFETIFLNSNIELSLATKSLFVVKEIYENHLITIVILNLSLLLLSFVLYKKNKKLRFLMDKFIINSIPLVSKVYKYRLMFRFFYVLSTLLKAKYEFDESIKTSKTLINNKYFLDRITRINSSLKSGKTVYESFNEAQVFDRFVLNIIKIAEVSNSLEKTSYEIRTIYKKRFDDKVDVLSVLIEPVFFILIMLLILWIVIAIFVPLWSMGDILKS